jgi:spermidine/putrescine-binding protein
MAGSKSVTETIKYLGWRGLDKPEVSYRYLSDKDTTLQSEYVRNGSNLLRLLLGRRSGNVDLITPSTDFGPMTKRELLPLLEPLDLSRLPAAKEYFPGFRTAPWELSSAPTTVPLLWGDSPVVYNPKVIDAVPESYADLADAFWKGKVVVRNEMYCILWMFSAALGHKDPGRITLAQLREVRKLARAIKENTVRIANSYREMTEMLVSGEAGIAISAWQVMCHWADVESGVELRFDTPKKDPKYWWVDGYAIARDAKNKDGAYGLLNHLLTPESNAALAWEMQSCSVTRLGHALMHPRLKGFYDTRLVGDGPHSEGPLSTRVSYIPPVEREGDIAGDADWQAVWLDFLLS